MGILWGPDSVLISGVKKAKCPQYRGVLISGGSFSEGFHCTFHLTKQKKQCLFVLLLTCTLDHHGVSLHDRVSVEPLHSKQESGRDEPLPEGRVVVVHTMQEKQQVDHTHCDPVHEVEGDETKSLPDEGDAADGHCHDDAEDHETGHSREDAV